MYTKNENDSTNFRGAATYYKLLKKYSTFFEKKHWF